MKKLVSALIVSALVLAATASTSLAGIIVTTSGVKAGPLTMALGSPSPLATTLDGTDLSVSGDLVPVIVTDARGSGAGWSLTITGTTFTGGGKSLPSDALSITGVAVSRSAGKDPQNGVTYGSGLTVPLGATAPTAAKFFTAAADSGMGKFTVTPAIKLRVPAETYAADYTSQITIDITTGP